MCAACVAQGAAYLVPAYAVVKTMAWQRGRREATREPTTSEPNPVDRRPVSVGDA